MKSLYTLLLSICILIGTNSCLVLVGTPHDNGKHAGWYKNPKNPHNPEHHEEEKGKSKEHGKPKGH